MYCNCDISQLYPFIAEASRGAKAIELNGLFPLVNFYFTMDPKTIEKRGHYYIALNYDVAELSSLGTYPIT